MVAIGIYVRQTGRVTLIVWFAVPMYLVGAIGMILAQAVGHPIALFIVSHLTMAVSRSSFETVKEAIMLYFAVADDSAVILAFLSLCEKMGGMVGAVLSDKFWADALPNGVKQYMSAESLLSSERIHPLLQQHLSHAIGSPERTLIQHAYDTTHRATLIVTITTMVVGLICARFVRNINVHNLSKPVVNLPCLAEDLTFGSWPHVTRLMPRRARPDVLALAQHVEAVLREYQQGCCALRQLLAKVNAAECVYPQHVADDMETALSYFVDRLSHIAGNAMTIGLLATITELNERLPHPGPPQTSKSSTFSSWCHSQ